MYLRDNTKSTQNMIYFGVQGGESNFISRRESWRCEPALETGVQVLTMTE